MKTELTMLVIIVLLFVTLIGFVLSYTSMKGNFDEVAALLGQCQLEVQIEKDQHGLCSMALDGALTRDEQCQSEVWGYEQLFLTCNDNLDQFVELSRSSFSLSIS